MPGDSSAAAHGSERPTSKKLPTFSSSGWLSAVGAVLIGLTLGAPGGLLLGAMEVVVLNCLEDLTNIQNIREELAKLVTQQDSIVISSLLGEFGFATAILSSTIGIWAGVVSYSLVIEVKGEEADGKALALAGSVCLMGVTATGAALGPILEKMLSSAVDTLVWNVIYAPVEIQYVIYGIGFVFFCLHRLSESLVEYCCRFFVIIFTIAITSLCLMLTFSLQSLFNSKAIALLVLSSLVKNWLNSFKCSRQNIIFDFVSVSVMLFTIELFTTLGKPIAFHTAVLTNTSSSSVNGEVIFIEVLTSQLFMAAIGMSLFVSWQKGAAGKICASAAASGTAVLGAIKLALPALGPGPSIGALMGVAGAVGVSLSAAGAKADSYGRVGRFGVTLGAAVGAFLASCAHSGLSGMLVGLCAAVIPGVHYVQVFFKFFCSLLEYRGFKLFSYILMASNLALWVYYVNAPIVQFILRYGIALAILSAFILPFVLCLSYMK